MQALLEKAKFINLAPVQLDSRREIKKLRVKQIQAKRRPTTPEEKKLKCLDCDSMRDFIAGLQGEVKRLQDLSNDLNMQMILAGCSIDLTPQPQVSKGKSH
jgi:hypothetical protein